MYINIKGKITFNVSFTECAKQKVQHIIYDYKIYFHKMFFVTDCISQKNQIAYI